MSMRDRVYFLSWPTNQLCCNCPQYFISIYVLIVLALLHVALTTSFVGVQPSLCVHRGRKVGRNTHFLQTDWRGRVCTEEQYSCHFPQGVCASAPVRTVGTTWRGVCLNRERGIHEWRVCCFVCHDSHMQSVGSFKCLAQTHMQSW